MESGDGLIVRLRITGGALSPGLAKALAQCAEACGNGLLDLSSRGNLQLRGVSEAKLAELQARLDGLGLLDADPEAEAVRNILASPLAGSDPSALLDIRPQVQALDERLRSDRSLHRLPGKFLFLIDDGGRLPLPYETADIAFIATAGEERRFFAIHLGGVPAGICGIDEICEAAARLAHAFLQLRREDDRRMADLIRRVGAEPIACAAGLVAMPKDAANGRHDLPRVLGFHALGSRAALGIGIPFGRLDAKRLRMSRRRGRSCWRRAAAFAVARHFPHRAADRPETAERMREAGFILDDDAPIRAVAACSGRPACLHGETASQADGAHLASLARGLAASGIALHVSGCAKGCAHPAKAPVTLIGRDGAYDLVLDGSRRRCAFAARSRSRRC